MNENKREGFISFDKPKAEVLNEEKYYQECIEYALDTGFIKEKQVDILRDKYLKPIFQKYLDIMREVDDEIKLEEAPGPTIEKIIEKLNIIMERTKRIGSTDPGNITRSIKDYYDFSCKNDTYVEYAAMALYQFVADTINQ